ncbi:hypothetical protein N7470_007168 [Penicillium chermesinum]|nr:hypothetical protein N7470_007168 [Penicillium chermesinum]
MLMCVGGYMLLSRGPMNRKHRLMIKLARTLSGIPTPTGGANEDGPDRLNGRNDDDDVNHQMQDLVNTAEQGADQAWKTTHSEQARVNQGQPVPMNKDEISMANAHLMERLRPFLTNPMAGMPVTVFFFDDQQSESRNIMTDESGHFSIRAYLQFVPTHIRVLASEDLSAARPIDIIEPVGISLISDIDDTIKHSAIASGAKEIFRNTFVRELGDLKVEGVSEWYTQLAKKGVEMHYVSNAPWQLYPLLERYFKMAGLPPGSFHLKQYSGMLQGIFEPTAERKRGSLEQLMRDFPQRKFILVGDSGEADLEVYTDIALANPGRILGIFIRDVTTPQQQPFFENSNKNLNQGLRSHTIAQPNHSDVPENRPALPPRRPIEVIIPADDAKNTQVGNLIDLDDSDTPNSTSQPMSTPKSRLPPTKPSKPSSLRSAMETARDSDGKVFSPELIRWKPVPPLPPRRGSAAKTDPLVDQDQSSPVSRSQTQPLGEVNQPPRSKAPPRCHRLGEATQPPRLRLQDLTPHRPGPKPSYASAALNYATERLNLSQAPSASLRQSPSNQSLGRTSSNLNSGSSNEPGMPPAPLPNKREELWRRRLERASGILEKHNVVLGSWRVGSDAQPVCLWLVEEALKKNQNSGSVDNTAGPYQR